MNFKCSCFIVLCVVVFCAAEQEEDGFIGVCVLEGVNGHEGIQGILHFTQKEVDVNDTLRDYVDININISAAPIGNHSLIIHEWGDLRSKDDRVIGEHYNPYKKSHNCPSNIKNMDNMEDKDIPIHSGDLGNVESVRAARGGTIITAELSLPYLRLFGERSLIGRGITLHSNPDTCSDKDSSYENQLKNKNEAIAHCVIGIANVEPIDNLAAPYDPENPDPVSATCVLVPTASQYPNSISGTLYMWINDTEGYMFAKVMGLEKGQRYNIYVHQYGDIRGYEGQYLGEHFDVRPDRPDHDSTNATIHQGDLGYVIADENGTGTFNTSDRGLVELIPKTVGRALAIQHEKTGERVAVCVVGLSSYHPQWTPSGVQEVDEDIVPLPWERESPSVLLIVAGVLVSLTVVVLTIMFAVRMFGHRCSKNKKKKKKNYHKVDDIDDDIEMN